MKKNINNEIKKVNELKITMLKIKQIIKKYLINNFFLISKINKTIKIKAQKNKLGKNIYL